MASVAESAREGDLYVVPPRAEPLEQFRLRAGAPIVVNWKSQPYGELEVLEWYEHNRVVAAFYQAGTTGAASLALEKLRAAYRPTFVVVENRDGPAKGALVALGARQDYGNESYLLYRLP